MTVTKIIATVGAITGVLGLLLGSLNTYKQFFEKPRVRLEIKDGYADITNNSSKTLSLYRVYSKTDIEFPLPIGATVTKTILPNGNVAEVEKPTYQSSFEIEFITDITRLEPHKGVVIELETHKIKERTNAEIEEFRSKREFLMELSKKKGFREKRSGLILSTTRFIVDHSYGQEISRAESTYHLGT